MSGMPTAPTKPGMPATSVAAQPTAVPTRPAAEQTAAPVVQVRAQKVEYRFDTNLFPRPEGVEDWSGAPRLESADLPGDFDWAKHRPLRRADFKNDFDFLEFKARQHDTVAASLRKHAENAKQLSSVGDVRKARKLQILQSQMSALLSELQSDGKTDLSKFMDDKVIQALMAKNSPSAS